MGCLKWESPWASTAPDTVKGFARRVYPPKLNAWRKFVADQTRHFEGMIDSWEVWNEPYHPKWWKGTAEEYVKILRVAYEEIKKVNSSIPVVGICGQSFSQGWVKDCLDAGALKYMDVFSYHDYMNFEKGGPEEYRPSWRDAIISHKQNLVKRGKPIPVWNTEGAVNSQSYYRRFYTGKASRVGLSPAYLVRAYASGLAAGQEKFYWFYLVGDPGPGQCGGLGMLEYNETPKSVIPAFAVCVKYLDGKKFVRELKPHKHTRCFVYEGHGNSTAVVWRILDAPDVTLKFSHKDVKVIDMMGNQLPVKDKVTNAKISAFPIYIEGLGSTNELVSALEKSWGDINK